MIVRWLIIAVVLVALSWMVMIVLARRLPPGLAKDLATVLPACLTTARRLRKDPRVPKRVRLAVTPRQLVGGGAIDVADEGTVLQIADREQIFQRGHGDGHGIGLALARSIAEADGGRLVLTRPQPTTFSLILLDPQEHDT